MKQGSTVRPVDISECRAWLTFVEREMRPWPCDLDLLCNDDRIIGLCADGHLRLAMVQGDGEKVAAAAAMSMNGSNLSAHILFVCLPECWRRTVSGGQMLLSIAEYYERMILAEDVEYVATTIPTDAKALLRLFQQRGWSIRARLPEYQRVRLEDGSCRRRDMLYIDWNVKTTY